MRRCEGGERGRERGDGVCLCVNVYVSSKKTSMKREYPNRGLQVCSDGRRTACWSLGALKLICLSQNEIIKSLKKENT